MSCVERDAPASATVCQEHQVESAQHGWIGEQANVDVEDIRATLTSLVVAGAQTQQEVKDVGGGQLVATVTDTDGNPIGLI